MNTHKVSLTEAYLIAYPNDTATIAENAINADWFSYYLTTDEDPMEPVSDIYYPILPDAADWANIVREGYDPSDHKLGGFLSVSFYWRDLLKGILPEGSDGIIVVFENGCNPTFGYQINGPVVSFLGVAEHYPDAAYAHLEKDSALLDLQEYSTIRDRLYSGIPVNEEYCPFQVRVYPSAVMEQAYTTNQPAIFAATAFVIFAFTAAVFIIYDWLVERRQKKVMKTAIRTNAIVTSLFPSNVRERMYETQEKQKQEKTTMKTTRKGRNFTGMDSINDSTEVGVTDGSLPIADLFPNWYVCEQHLCLNLPIHLCLTCSMYFCIPHSTVLFADIAGFTAWTSSREPTQVFVLLETLYGAFDKIARRR